ncbi:UDP-glucose--hexose-1-phosphate uridylyltransferase [Staphylococcus sp. SQ8-PEA]|uniref:Galactose-1-phosphate uridylyltransferase n=1 Tax=Staphylococcus marylandisciuri TaxID=2981529 RepID=A0ABT2QMH8_9STAP|nr:UDP-glucose--hexose-1-phosphate uridylyltransferase [Staphylococcus marylandisciuri]MCU5745188.1 UDP-glucose--hexose-1-phosphate uridylyltransferase [Staphylococcus marylandisciuri]
MLLNQSMVSQFINLVVHYGDYEDLDRLYIQNQLIRILSAQGVETSEISLEITEWSPVDFSEYWINQMIQHGLIENVLYEREIIEAQLLDLITPRPSTINHQFHHLLSDSPQRATNYFYALSKRNNYVKEKAIAKNIEFEVPTEYGDIELTINLSKPEKSAKDIALAKEAESVEYPKCALCIENEGYQGSVSQAARSNHRVIRLDLDGETWGFQYSPYAYFQEHSIVLSREHTPMDIGRQTFINLFAFIDQIPHYFIGSNADIPLVGGSILSHNHYQTGRHTFPMDRAKEINAFEVEGYEGVSCYTLYWPMSVIRLKSDDKARIVDLASYILKQWMNYSDAEVGVRAYSDSGERHHTVTPIARLRDKQYELDLVLRDNQTSEAYPDGIFHPHPDVQHIKKENIGLIEVMGTAILPARLKEEIHMIQKYLLGEKELETKLGVHFDWVKEMESKYDFNEANIDSILREEIGHKFKRVLEDAGVFKNDHQGQMAFMRFIKSL